jgi:hypothetical protein
MSRKMVVPLNLLTMSTDPVGAIEGDVYFNVLTKNIRIYNGITWLELTPPSDDPTPFYPHTHAFDGSVHSIDVENVIRFDSFNNESGPQINIPQVVGIEGGTPMSNNDSGTYQDLTLLDGGEHNSMFEPEIDDTIVDGGSAATSPEDEILDLGDSN